MAVGPYLSRAPAPGRPEPLALRRRATQGSPGRPGPGSRFDEDENVLGAS